MLKLASLWQTQYRVTVVVDNDNLLAKPRYDVIGLLENHAKEGPCFFVYPGGVQGSPDNAAFIASIPNQAFYEHFSEGIAHGYHQVDGWGGAYDKREKEFMNQHSKPGCDFCWNGATFDQGLLWYIGFGTGVSVPCQRQCSHL